MKFPDRRRLFEIMEEAAPGDRASSIFDTFIIVLITLNIAAVVLETVPSLHDALAPEFLAIEIVSVVIFTVEYLLRLWVATEHPALKRFGPFWGRVRFAISPGAIIDLLAFLPFYLTIIFGGDLRVLRVLRLLRFLKLMRYSSAMMTMQRVIYDERRALIASLLIMLGLLIVSSTAIYHVEREVQPQAFGSIPAAMWWALATLTSVGYGDIVPVTVPGKMIGGLVMLFGLGMFALPLGIIAMGFAEEVHQRDFVVTKVMVARIPLFCDLDVREVTHISRLMRARRYQTGATIVRHGDRPEDLLIIANGEVEFEAEGHVIVLGDGAVIGMHSVLRARDRDFSAIAQTPVQVMMLPVADARDLIARYPQIGTALRESMEDRESRLSDAPDDGD